MKNYLSADVQLAPEGGFQGFGPLGNPAGSGINIFAKFISSTIGFMTIIAILWFIFVLFGGAIGMIGAGGDKTKLESSRHKVTSGLIGLVVTIAAIFIIKLIGQLIGIPNILNFGALFEQIQK